MNQIDRSILSFFAGAAVGVVAGVLFAPDKGSVTRERLLRGAEELAGELEESLGGKSPERVRDTHGRKEELDTEADEIPAV